MRYEKHMLAAVCGGSEDVGVAAVFQLQLLAQYSHGHGEIAHGDVGICDIAQRLFQLPLVEGRDGVYGKPSAGEARDELLGGEEVAVGAYLASAERQFQLTEASSFHYRSVRFVEVRGDVVWGEKGRQRCVLRSHIVLLRCMLYVYRITAV